MDENPLRVDMHALHIELSKQPTLYHTWADKLAKAKAEKDRLETLLKLTEAKLDQRIREHPSSYGLAKVTEPAVEKAIILSDKYQEVMGDLNEVKEEVYHLTAMVASVDAKKDVITDLVKLSLADYFSTPSVPSETREEADDALAKRVAARSRKK